MQITWDMTAGEVGQIIAVSTAVIVSLVIGIRSIRQTRQLQKNDFKRNEEIRRKEYRKNLLDDIIKWAIEASNPQRPLHATDALMAQNFKLSRYYMSLDVAIFRSYFQASQAKSAYIIEITRALHKEKLEKAINGLIIDIDQMIVLLNECYSTILATAESEAAKIDAAFNNLIEHERKIGKSAYEVILNAVKVKTDEVG